MPVFSFLLSVFSVFSVVKFTSHPLPSFSLCLFFFRLFPWSIPLLSLSVFSVPSVVNFTSHHPFHLFLFDFSFSVFFRGQFPFYHFPSFQSFPWLNSHLTPFGLFLFIFSSSGFLRGQFPIYPFQTLPWLSFLLIPSFLNFNFLLNFFSFFVVLLLT
jgi:hypothetical protein